MKSDIKIKNLDSHAGVELIWFMWQIGGITPGREYSVYYLIYTIFINIMVLICFPISLGIDLIMEHDLKAALNNLSMVLTLVALTIKYYIIFMYKSHLYKANEILRTLDKRAEQNADEKQCLQEGIKFCRQMFRVYCCTYFTTAIFFILAPLLSHQRLIFPGWFPFDLTVKRNFYIAYIYQALALTLVSVTQNIANDIFPPTYICILTAQIEALSVRIRKIGKKLSVLPVGHYNELIDCILDHKKILELFEEIRLLVTRTLGIQFVVTAFVLCIAAVKAFLFSTELLEIIALIMYLAAVILEVLPACYFANRLLEINGKLAEAIFNCNWIDQDLKFKKTVIIFMQRTQKSLIILAGNIFPITLPTFLAIIKFSFSMFTILLQINK